MQALSLAAAVEGLSQQPMTEKQHALAFAGESYNGAVVYHLGTPKFYHYYLSIEKELGLKRMCLPVKRPSFLHLQKLLERPRGKMGKVFFGSRDRRILKSPLVFKSHGK